MMEYSTILFGMRSRDRARNLQNAEEAQRRDKMNGAEGLVRTQ